MQTQTLLRIRKALYLGQIGQPSFTRVLRGFGRLLRRRCACTVHHHECYLVKLAGLADVRREVSKYPRRVPQYSCFDIICFTLLKKDARSDISVVKVFRFKARYDFHVYDQEGILVRIE